LSRATAGRILRPPGGLLIRHNRSLAVHLLSLAFLFAQLGMAVHASSHLKAEPHGAPAQVCGQCASFAPLQNMLGGGVAVILPVAVVHEHAVAVEATSIAPRGTRAAFRSRAPPVSS
jgi:hypothetical protein